MRRSGHHFKESYLLEMVKSCPLPGRVIAAFSSQQTLMEDLIYKFWGNTIAFLKMFFLPCCWLFPVVKSSLRNPTLLKFHSLLPMFAQCLPWNKRREGRNEGGVEEHKQDCHYFGLFAKRPFVYECMNIKKCRDCKARQALSKQTLAFLW